MRYKFVKHALNEEASQKIANYLKKISLKKLFQNLLILKKTLFSEKIYFNVI